MKILFIIGSLEKGGAERVVTTLSNKFINKDEVFIITTSSRPAEYCLNENIIRYSICEDEKNINNFLKIKKMKKYILSIQPDIIIAFLPEPSFRACILKYLSPKIRKIPLIISIRNDPKIEYKKKYMKILMKILYIKANGFVFQTLDAQKYFNRRIQKRSEIIFNPINQNFTAFEPIVKRKKTIVSVGRLEAQKNHKMLISAFNMIKDKYNDYIINIYGEGSQKSSLQLLINELNLNNQVFLKGQYNNIENEIFDASLFVMTSNYEGMPNALMEAMALGIPVISTDCPCGGPRSLIKNNENGKLIKVGDILDLAKNIDEILSSKATMETFSINGSKIVNNLNPEKICNQWYNYIEKVLNKKN